MTYLPDLRSQSDQQCVIHEDAVNKMFQQLINQLIIHVTQRGQLTQ